jgi:competence ComEA-like helix-hairpin-helix protein
VKWKQFIDDYFVFSKKERVGMYVLSVVTLLVWIIPYLFSKDENIEALFEVNYVRVDSAEQLLLSRNEQFKQADIKRAFTERGRSDVKSWASTRRSFAPPTEYAYPKKQLQPIDINKADSLQFEQLPAIGIKLSSRIVRYRERLGGFLTIEQIKEVYGISDSAFQVILPFLKIEKGFMPQKMEINKADYSALRKHPYTNHEFIKMILAYRKSHGPFREKADMEKIIQLDLKVLEKIMPYLSFQD